MIDISFVSFKNYTMQLCSQTIVLRIFMAGIASLTFNSHAVQAQSDRSGLGEGSSSESAPALDNETNQIKPFRQNSFSESGGSQQFFRQGNDNLYFLPEKKSDSILQIDKDIETEVERQDLPSVPSNKQ